MRKPKNSKLAVKEEVIAIDSDTETERDKVGSSSSRVLAVYKASCEETVYANDEDDDFDLEYKKYLTSYLLEYNVEEKEKESSPSPLLLTFDVGKEEESSHKKKKLKTPSVCIVSKRLKTEDGRVDRSSKLIQVKEETSRLKRKLIKTENGTKATKEKSRPGRKPKPPLTSTVLKKSKKMIPVKEKSRAGRKPKSLSIPIVSKRLKTETNSKAIHKPFSKTVKTKQEERKKVYKKENTKSQTVLRSSKRLKTENVEHKQTRTTNGKKEESLRGSKIKNHVESKTKAKNTQIKKEESMPQRRVTKEEKLHSYKDCKNFNEEKLSAYDKSYGYYMTYIRNSITIFTPEHQKEEEKKPVRDLVCLSDSDIIAISAHPFCDVEGNTPFEANKDDKVIDLEDGDVSEEMFNSPYSKKLLEVLRKPYDETELLKLKDKAKQKKPLTRTRELRDGREIEYVVQGQFTNSYLDYHTDFKTKFSRYGKDSHRALNLLRGLFFFVENVACEGSFKPWHHEKRLESMRFDAIQCFK